MGGVQDLPFGCATSVGPVPHADPDEAARFACSTGGLLSAPVVADPAGSLLAQALAGVPGVRVTPPGLVRIDPEILEPSAHPSWCVGLDDPAFAALRSFLGRVEPGSDIRLPVLGPVTTALALRAAGVELEHAAALAVHLVGGRAVALLDAVRRVSDGVAMVCLDEPALIGAMHPTFPLAPVEVATLLEPVVDRLDRHPQAGELLIGLHVPGRTDWRTLAASGVSVLCVPVGADLAGWAVELGDFLERGGRIAWGAVPVDQPLGATEELLWRRLSATWCDLVGAGVDPLALRASSLVQPADGLGHFGHRQARHALDLVEALARKVRRQAVGARLTLGA